ncbi:hypothetical protein FJ527_23270 [Mesorhizobium sp. B2-4-18]|uniref:hypothetical protein n=1 Tax=Mesorhizobium sp. B2-4-18 TaxID=2589931 RepID=UPI001126F36D|nr:hypothetical protein [Mesorhizobium sp. B2-4-18]TPK73307.1 hypothetical protein FJ527_23270 [Mesorhizobium sp. B2-4-18]
MKMVFICLALVLAGSNVAAAHEKKATVTASKACAGLSFKAAVAAKLDCTATGTATSTPTDAANAKPRLGYQNPWTMSSFGL